MTHISDILKIIPRIFNKLDFKRKEHCNLPEVVVLK